MTDTLDALAQSLQKTHAEYEMVRTDNGPMNMGRMVSNKQELVRLLEKFKTEIIDEAKYGG